MEGFNSSVKGLILAYLWLTNWIFTLWFGYSVQYFVMICAVC
jgi:hypothetical protein